MNGLITILILSLVGFGLFQAHRFGYDRGYKDGYDDGEEEGSRGIRNMDKGIYRALSQVLKQMEEQQ